MRWLLLVLVLASTCGGCKLSSSIFVERTEGPYKGRAEVNFNP